jgi:hypothetical protein
MSAGIREVLDRNEVVGEVRSGSRRFWTGREELLLREFYARGGVPACLPVLPGRTASSIYNRANQLKLKSPQAQRSGPRERWTATPHMDEQIRRAYENPTKGAIKTLARSIGRPYHWVKGRAQKIGCVGVSFREPPWSSHEMAIITARATQHPNVIAKALRSEGYRRTATAIVVKLKRLHVSRIDEDNEDMSARGFGALMGVDVKTVTRWIEKGWLLAKGKDPYKISRRSARRFIAENVSVVDLRKVDKDWFVDLLLERDSASPKAPLSLSSEAA